ncbi:MAG: hypothetical protein KDA99_10655 [Planctomycetales bacterium]|nr:hypothetical protein [Planctomycetales bacterium]
MDLQEETAGDDWGFVNHLVGLVGSVEKRFPPLVVIDAIEGLETFVGETDQFGEGRTRRSRIAQLTRLATQVGVQLVFVVEEPDGTSRLPEQYVADLVIRLRYNDDTSYVQRYIEIEKCRGVAHARGKHEFSIRSGLGTFTGRESNIDDPFISWVEEVEFDIDRIANTTTLAHIHISESLHLRSRQVRSTPQLGFDLIGAPTFGLERLDKRVEIEKSVESRQNRESHQYSLPGSFTVLFGEPGTFKSRLARRFLAQTFVDNKGKTLPLQEQGVAVLITTGSIEKEMLRDKILLHLAAPDATNISQLSSRLLCRRINVRHLSSAYLMQIVDRHLFKAHAILHGKMDIDELRHTISHDDLRKVAHRIRIVIEDWQSIIASHPLIRDEPLALETVASALQREGVTSLIVSSQSGALLERRSRYECNDLERLDVNQIVTWSVPFFGERRVAIGFKTAITHGGPSHVFELCPRDPSGFDDTESLSVNPHFALYESVGLGNPKRIPLAVRLYGGNHTPNDNTMVQFAKVVADAFSQVFIPCRESTEVVSFDDAEAYEGFFTFADNLDNSRLDHSIVFQIDEFWSDGKRSLLSLDSYFNAIVAERNSSKEDGWIPRSDEDVYSLFHPRPFNEVITTKRTKHVHELTRRTAKLPYVTRRDMFRADTVRANGEAMRVDRIPYLWDFGMIVAEYDYWNTPSLRRRVLLNDGRTVSDVFDRLSMTSKRPPLPVVTWGEFFTACQVIAEYHKTATFDVDLSTPETLSCLVLEIWASLRMEMVRNATGEDPFGEKRTIKEMCTMCSLTLFIALAQLIAACPHLTAKNRRVCRDHVSPRAAASREWYHTASAIFRERGNERRLVLLRLPGFFSTRGDWSLAAAAGSRSPLLAHRALDILSSRRLNLLRLQDGIGLPVRDIVRDDQMGELVTAINILDPAIGGSRRLRLSEIVSIGADWTPGFNWLWRSRILRYDRDSFYFRRWVARMIEESAEWIPNELKGLDALTEVARNIRYEQSDQESLSDLSVERKFLRPFDERVEILRAALRI